MPTVFGAPENNEELNKLLDYAEQLEAQLLETILKIRACDVPLNSDYGDNYIHLWGGDYRLKITFNRKS